MSKHHCPKSDPSARGLIVKECILVGGLIGTPLPGLIVQGITNVPAVLVALLLGGITTALLQQGMGSVRAFPEENNSSPAQPRDTIRHLTVRLLVPPRRGIAVTDSASKIHIIGIGS